MIRVYDQVCSNPISPYHDGSTRAAISFKNLAPLTVTFLLTGGGHDGHQHTPHAGVRRPATTQLLPAEMDTLNDIISVYRKRLTSLSWFMKCLNEPIAREANKEDHSTGHFWEARYKSQALLTVEAVLSCMVYVDLNPIRAGLTDKPETSDCTSVQERIAPQLDLAHAIQQQTTQQSLNHFDLPLKPLLAFSNNMSQSAQHDIPYHFSDYLELLDWTGRAIREDKTGFIPHYLPPILDRLSVTEKEWLLNTQRFEDVHTRQCLNHRRKRRIN